MIIPESEAVLRHFLAVETDRVSRKRQAWCYLCGRMICEFAPELAGTQSLVDRLSRHLFEEHRESESPEIQRVRKWLLDPGAKGQLALHFPVLKGWEALQEEVEQNPSKVLEYETHVWKREAWQADSSQPWGRYLAARCGDTIVHERRARL